jgi:hypothetical protein
MEGFSSATIQWLDKTICKYTNAFYCRKTYEKYNRTTREHKNFFSVLLKHILTKKNTRSTFFSCTSTENRFWKIWQLIWASYNVDITECSKTRMKCQTVISGFCRDVDEIHALLRYYTVSNGNPLQMFRDVSIFLFFLDVLTLEDGSDTLFWNVGTELPLGAA